MAVRLAHRPAENQSMTLLLVLVGGWCVLATAVAFGLGPLLHRAAVLTDAHERPRPEVGAGP